MPMGSRQWLSLSSQSVNVFVEMTEKKPVATVPEMLKGGAVEENANRKDSANVMPICYISCLLHLDPEKTAYIWA